MPDEVYALYINGSKGIKNTIDNYIEYAKTTKINSFNNYYVLIANPNISASTKDVFTRFDDFKSKINDYNECEMKFKNCIYAINNKNIKFLSENLFNNLEIVTESMHEEIRILKNEIFQFFVTYYNS